MNPTLSLKYFLVLIVIAEALPLLIIEYKKTLNKNDVVKLLIFLIFSLFLSFLAPEYAQFLLIGYAFLKFFLIKRNFVTWLAPSLTFIRDNLLFTLSWFIAFDFLNWVYKNKSISFYQACLFILLIISEFIFTNYVYKKKDIIKNLKIINKKYILFSLTSLLTFTFLISIHRYNILHYNPSLFIYSFLLLVLGGLLVFSYLFFISYLYKLNSYNSFLNTTLKSINENYDRLENFKHDYKNILISLYKYTDSNDVAALKEYINDILDYSSEYISSNLDREILKINNYAIQSTIVSFTNQVASNSKYYTLNLTIADGDYSLGDELIDAIRCLSILLNNVLEEKNEKSTLTIDVTIYTNQDAIVFEIKNSLSTDLSLSKIQRKNYSTKKSHKGRGLYSLSKIVAQQKNFDYSIEIDDNFFTAKFIIYTS